MSIVATQVTKIEKSIGFLGAIFLIAGIALAAVGMGTSNSDPNALAHGYMFGWVYWACLTLGCFALTLLHHCARGSWGFPTVRIFEAGGGPISLAVFGALLAPIALMWKQVFYPWAVPAEVAADKVLQHRAAWNNLWDARLIFYFAVFIAMAVLNKNWSKKEDETGDAHWWKKRQYYGGLFIVAFVTCLNFLWTDVLMGQYAHWYSTIYGVWLMVGSILAAFAFCAIILGTQSKKKPYDKVVEPWLVKDIGNWLLTFTMLWAYFSLSQYLIIWSGNLEEFTHYFVQRSRNGWDVHGTLLIATNFFVPFLLLLAPRTKRVPLLLASVGVYILVARFLDLWYVVTPAWKANWGINAIDIGMLLLFGGVWMLLFAWQFTKASPITHRNPVKEDEDHV